MKRINFSIILLFLTFSTGLAVDVEQLIADAQHQFISGDYNSAMDLFMQVLIKDPQNKLAKKALKKIAEKVVKMQEKAISKQSAGIIKGAQPGIQQAQTEKKMLHKKMDKLFKSSRKSFLKRRLLQSADKLRQILLECPDYNRAKQCYKDIEYELYSLSKIEHTADLEKLAYAKGYVFYRQQKYREALGEWEKVLQLNPKKGGELNEYVTEVSEYLKNEELLTKEKEIEDKVKQTFEEGCGFFDNKEWVPCIKSMENVQFICRNEPFPMALEWNNKAQECIEKAVQSLSETVEKTKSEPDPKLLAVDEQPVQQIDYEGSKKKYNEGLIAYAQGKLFNAVNAWEIAIRLNPSNKKAVNALKKAKKEMKSQEVESTPH